MVSSRLDRVGPVAAFLIPWLAALLQVSPITGWSDDASILRAFGSAPRGFSGLVSASLDGIFSFLPVGTPVMRAGSASALALGLCGWLVYRLARRHLGLGAEPLHPALAALAGVTATLAPSFFVTGVSIGGGSVAAALALFALDRAAAGSTAAAPTQHPGNALISGAALAAVVLESRPAAVSALVSVAVLVLVRRPRSAPAFALRAAAGAALVLLLPVALAVGLWVSPAGAAAERVGSFGAFGAAAAREGIRAVQVWMAELGLIWSALAVLGVAGSRLRERGSLALTLSLLSLVALSAVDWSTGAARTSTDADRNAPGVALGLAALSVLTCTGLRFVVALLSRARLPLARPASVLLVVYGFSLVFVSAEDAANAADARESTLTERWTDEALLSLPPKGLLLLQSDAVFLRLEAARALGGLRPDLLVVPTSALNQRSVRLDLVDQEAALLPVVRDVLLSGKPSELSLSGLADTRPMYVELDTDWDARLFTHLVPHAFFSEFAPHPLGRSDRTLGVEGSFARFDAVAAALRSAPALDPATRQVLARSLSERAILLELLGDRAAAAAVTEDLLLLCPGHSVGTALHERISRKLRSTLDVRRLLASR